MKTTTKKEDKFKYYSDLKNEDDLQNMTSNMKTNEDELKDEDVLKNCPPTQQQFCPPPPSPITILHDF